MPIKYIGSKRRLVPLLARVVGELAPRATVVDLFSGTARVGHALKAAGHRVLANDSLACGEAIARCYVEADLESVGREARLLVRELEALPGDPGWFTETFCVRSRYLRPENGARVDAIREAIAEKGLRPELEAVLLVALMEAADRVDSTTGLQMAYLKSWAPRALLPLSLRVPDLLPRAAAGAGRATRLDALQAVDALEGEVVYLDPPYNQHSYLGNYHVWESLVLWDKPEVYGTACKRVDCRERPSAFNRRSTFRAAFERVALAARAPHLVVSFSNEGFLSRDDVEAILARRGEVLVLENDVRRYVGAQIGIHNPRGEKVGVVSHVRATEYVFVVGEGAARVRRLLAGVAPYFPGAGGAIPGAGGSFPGALGAAGGADG